MESGLSFSKYEIWKEIQRSSQLAGAGRNLVCVFSESGLGLSRKKETKPEEVAGHVCENFPFVKGRRLLCFLLWLQALG